MIQINSMCAKQCLKQPVSAKSGRVTNISSLTPGKVSSPVKQFVPEWPSVYGVSDTVEDKIVQQLGAKMLEAIYGVEMDLEKFFNSMDNEKWIEILSDRIEDHHRHSLEAEIQMRKSRTCGSERIPGLSPVFT